MKTILTYYHTRNLFTKNEFKSFVKKYFKDVKYLGAECGNYSPSISISNWDEIKYKIPKYAIPIKIGFDMTNMTSLKALVNGQLGLAREMLNR